MKHNKVLNRPMFNAQNSAYGRGITSNLVSEEQRIRYNSGGRVGLKYGSEWLMKLPGAKKAMKWGTSKLSKIPGYDKLQGQLTLPGMTTSPMIPKLPKWGKFGAKDIATGKSIAGKGAGWAKALGKQMFDRPVRVGLPVVGGAGWGISKFFGGEEEELPRATGDGQWEEKLQVTKKPTKVDPDSDTLDWTPQEKKEKIGQIQLKLAQRLVGGARDKWGSKAQMKNIGDAFGDVAAIGDKTELRKDERKYKAWGKQERLTAEAAHDRKNNYMGMINAGSDHPTALYRTTGIPGALTMSADPKQRKDQKEQIEARGPGTVFFDETSNSWHIFTPDGSIKVTIDQIQDAYRTGKIDKMREKPVAKTPKVIEEEEKETIEFDPDNPTIARAGVITPDFSKVLLN